MYFDTQGLFGFVFTIAGCATSFVFHLYSPPAVCGALAPGVTRLFSLWMLHWCRVSGSTVHEPCPWTGLPDWLFWRQISQIWLFLEVVGVKKLFGFLAFSFQYLAFLEAVGTYYQTGVLTF